MPIDSYTQYQTLTRAGPLAPGDLLLKKIFRETRTHVIEWAITSGQKLFEGDQTVKTGGLFSREKFRVKYQGSHTSEHAAIAISADELAEAIGD